MSEDIDIKDRVVNRANKGSDGKAKSEVKKIPEEVPSVQYDENFESLWKNLELIPGHHYVTNDPSLMIPIIEMMQKSDSVYALIGLTSGLRGSEYKQFGIYNVMVALQDRLIFSAKAKDTIINSYKKLNIQEIYVRKIIHKIVDDAGINEISKENIQRLEKANAIIPKILDKKSKLYKSGGTKNLTLHYSKIGRVDISCGWLSCEIQITIKDLKRKDGKRDKRYSRKENKIQSVAKEGSKYFADWFNLYHPPTIPSKDEIDRKEKEQREREAEEKAYIESKRKAAVEAKVRKEKAAVEAKVRKEKAAVEAKAKLPKIVCRVEKSGNAYRAWSTDGYDYTPEINSSTRRRAFDGNYLLGQFESPRGHKSWRRITATVLKNLGGERNIVFEDHKEKPKRISKKKPATRKRLKGYETLVLYESPELEEVVNDLNLRLRTFGHYVMFIQIYMAGVDGKVTRNETATLKAHKGELIQGMINTTGASERHAESYMDETMKDARSLYNEYQQTGKLDLSYAVCIRQLARFAQGIGNWAGPPGTRPTGPHLKALYSYLNDIALADGDLDFGESKALQFAASEWSSAPGYAQYDPYQ